MASEPKIVIYYGPPSWFHDQVGASKTKNFMTLINERDALRKLFRVVVAGHDGEEPISKLRRPNRVVAESADFASIQEHAITNFANLVQELHPKHLLLNNPPSRVHEQLIRAFPSTRVERHTYPTITPETLRQFRDGFADHLVGQRTVRELLLATMYPLIRPGRTKPVVVMLYGPSGVGKTETAHFINGLLGGDLLRKQFSMFHSDKFASYLFGGEHSEASLARDLLDRESGVILIDEFDKANPVFHSAFYELFDSGRFVDKNYSVDVGPALFICTSNYKTDVEIREALGDALASRFDALIEYTPLTQDEIVQVVERTVSSKVAKLSAEEQEHVDRSDLLSRLLVQLVDGPGNVRQIGKTIDSSIGLVLVRSMLSEHLAAAPTETGMEAPSQSAEA
ncbi:AAA family ATPase [Aeromicrobium chenweiae]|uniref:ATP-dependent Clp protease ATP-binding subunit n=1 Tax=Aeromicrobium chenweiae TaxID=2079793 RepID=A0A2S0WII3_9ACTN|nr:AAA family ATPase [Aeromicrobium chenweiae]AWB91148.1 ATP-dependent Clp protease ATP-binding subunit [Aeromicrobium chenweiae]TGN31668.1 AAA family ATPase [Aeromicrobium chenweiae]